MTHKGIILGTEKGKVEGKAEGLLQQKTTLLEMLSDRFTEIPSSWVLQINCLDDPKRINQLTRAIYKVKSAQEFNQMLENSQ